MEALRLHIEGMIEDGDAIPEASTLDALANDPATSGAVAFLVNIAIAEKAVRSDITARRRQMAEIDRRSRKEGMTRPAYMVASALIRTKEKPSGRIES